MVCCASIHSWKLQCNPRATVSLTDPRSKVESPICYHEQSTASVSVAGCVAFVRRRLGSEPSVLTMRSASVRHADEASVAD